MIESGVEKRGLVVAGLAVSLFPIVYLHVVSIGELNPIRHTISDYVFVDGGASMLAATALTLAAASTVLLLSLRDVGRSASWLMGLWSAGLTVATIFPTDPDGVPTSFSGLVHRYAGAVMFVSLPLAALLISRRNPKLRRLAILSGGASAAFLLSHVSIYGFAARGLAERVLFAVLYGLLFTLATQMRRTS